MKFFDVPPSMTAADAKPLETPDTYAQAAKLQRRALMREKHAQQLDTLKVGQLPVQRCRCMIHIDGVQLSHASPMQVLS